MVSYSIFFTKFKKCGASIIKAPFLSSKRQIDLVKPCKSSMWAKTFVAVIIFAFPNSEIILFIILLIKNEQ